MHKFMTFAASAVFILGLAAAPASADWKEDCAADIKAVEEAAAFAKSGWVHKATVESLVFDAKEALKSGKKKKCKVSMKKAKNKVSKIR